MDCGAARILRSVLWDSWYADAHFFFDEPNRFDLCSGLQRGRQRFFLGQDFGFCCKEARLLVVIPGTILFLAGGPITGTMNVLLQDALWTGLLCTRFVYPNFSSFGPFERETPVTLFPK